MSESRIVIGSKVWERAVQSDFLLLKKFRLTFLYLIFIVIIRLLKVQSHLLCVYVDSWTLVRCSAHEKSTFSPYFLRISGVNYNGGSGLCFIWMRYSQISHIMNGLVTILIMLPTSLQSRILVKVNLIFDLLCAKFHERIFFYSDSYIGLQFCHI